MMTYAFKNLIDCLIITVISLSLLYFMNKALKKYSIVIPIVCLIVSVLMVLNHLGSLNLLTENTMMSNPPFLFVFLILILSDLIPVSLNTIFYVKLKKCIPSEEEYRRIKIKDL